MHYRQRIQVYLQRDTRRIGGLRFWLVFRCLPALVIASLLLLICAVPTRAVPAANPGLAALDDLRSGHVVLRDEQTGEYVPALMHSSKVHFDISGLLASVRVEQSFRNNTDRWLEGVYAFPLPETAAVRYMEMVIGQRRVVGKVREKALARKLYEQARTQGKKASLVQQQRPNLFTNRIANIAPGEEITVKLEYVQQVEFSADVFSLRFPMTITPRYMPGIPTDPDSTGNVEQVLAVQSALGWARPTDQVPDADVISPFQRPDIGSDAAPLNPIEISASLDMGMPLASVSSPYHEIALSRRAGVYDIKLAAARSEMNRDFVLNWQPVTGAAPVAAFFTEQVGDEHFGLLMVLPPAAPRTGEVLSRELVFVVDTSGSMGGVSIEQARASVSRALQQLQPHDRFNIIAFNTTHRSLYRRSMPATRHHVQRAQEFVRQLAASGGTEMLPALQAALDPVAQDDEHYDAAALRQVIFITDGAVGNETALFEHIAARLGNSRLFTVGIGSAPNSWFMRKAASFGRGTHTHIGDLKEVGTKMAALFEQLSQPAALNLAVHWPMPVEAWPERLPDLYRGQPVTQSVRLGAAPPRGKVRVTADINGRPWTSHLQIDAVGDPQSAPGHAGVASLWARAKIAALLDQKVQGRPAEEVRSDVLDIALQHQLLSPYTSFIAVEERPARPPGAELSSAAAANSRPLGQSPQTFAYPATATTGPAKAWFGMLCLFIAIIVRVIRQSEVDHVRAPRD